MKITIRWKLYSWMGPPILVIHMSNWSNRNFLIYWKKRLKPFQHVNGKLFFCVTGKRWMSQKRQRSWVVLKEA
jgi:hypothetical protein